MMTEIVIVSDVETGDWQGIYIDGDLKYEGHSLDPGHVLGALDIAYTRLFAIVDGHLPQKLDKVKTLEEWEREQKLIRAQELRAQAEKLEREANDEKCS